MWKISVVSVESAARELAIRGDQWGFLGSPPPTNQPRGTDKIAPVIPTNIGDFLPLAGFAVFRLRQGGQRHRPGYRQRLEEPWVPRMPEIRTR
jgi:hypothetical protein